MKFFLLISFLIAAKPKKGKKAKKTKGQPLLQESLEESSAHTSLLEFPSQHERHAYSDYGSTSGLYYQPFSSTSKEDMQQRETKYLDDPPQEYVPSEYLKDVLDISSGENISNVIKEDMSMLALGIRERDKSIDALSSVDYNVRLFSRTLFIKLWNTLRENLNLKGLYDSSGDDFDLVNYTNLINVDCDFMYELSKSTIPDNLMDIFVYLPKFIRNLSTDNLEQCKSMIIDTPSIFSDLKEEIKTKLNLSSSEGCSGFNYNGRSKELYIILNELVCNLFSSEDDYKFIDNLNLKSLILMEHNELQNKCRDYLVELYTIKFYLKNPYENRKRYFVVYVLLKVMNTMLFEGMNDLNMRSIDICYHYIMLLLNRSHGILRDLVGAYDNTKKYNNIKLLVYDLFSEENKSKYYSDFIKGFNDSYNDRECNKGFIMEIFLNMIVMLYDKSFSEFTDEEKKNKLNNLDILEKVLSECIKNVDYLDTSKILICCEKIYDFCIHGGLMS